ncbi:MAG: diguanylate cyclase [Stagnimonas sp.]|nr:diguanylate cyclase [Stagnimonas sp.]
MPNASTQLTRLHIHNRLIALAVLMGVGILVFLLFFYQSFSSSLRHEKEAQTRSLSEAGLRVLRHFHQLGETGRLSPEQAQQLARGALESATYGDSGYFWIIAGTGTLLVQPYTPERVGADLSNWTDIQGKYIVREFLATAKAGGGWVSYYWPKPHAQGQYPKVSYVLYFEPWDWVLGTGVYLDDSRAHVTQTVLQASGILLLAFAGFVLALVLAARYFLRQLESIAIRDALTNLYTMRFLREITPSILSKQQRDGHRLLAAIFIDIDHFKQVNDRYGHDSGDQVLKRVAQVMTSLSRAGDFCVRFGGEEFVLIGFFDDEAAAVQVAERIRTETARLSFSHRKTQFQLTLSAGIAIYHPGAESFDDLLKRADQKMYQAKEQGRNRVLI